MAIKQTITDDYHFWTWLKQSDSYGNNFTLAGAKALQEYLDNLSDELDEDIEFDPIAWCVEYSEYENLADFNQQYFSDNRDGYYKDIDELQDNTTVIELENGGFVMQDF